MLDMILQTIEKGDMSNSLDKVNNEYIIFLTKMEKEILSKLIHYFEGNVFIDSEVAEEILNKNKINIRKYFGKFVKLNILIPLGKTKGRKYKLNREIFNKEGK